MWLMQDFFVRTLVLLPIEPEVAAFLKALSAHHSYVSHSVGRIEGFYFPKLRLFCVRGGHGKVEFAIRSQHLLERLPNCEKVFLLGTAGSLNSRLKTGDLVVATSTLEHDFKLKFVQRPLPEFFGSPELLGLAQQFQSKNFLLHFEKVASGDEDVLESSRAQEITGITNAVAVAWEGAGLGRVARFNQISHLEIRAISDFADNMAVKDFYKNLEAGMDHGAQLIEYLARF